MSDIAWLAGLIEGDGSYYMGTWTRKEGEFPKIGIQIKLYSTDAQIIRKAEQVLRNNGIGFHLGEREQKPLLKPSGEGHYYSPNSMLTITVSRLASIEALVNLLEPWTFGEKRHRLLLIKDYVTLRVTRIASADGNFRAVPVSESEMVIVEEFKKLHRKDASTTGCETP